MYSSKQVKSAVKNFQILTALFSICLYKRYNRH
ncbi:unknown [[Mannheimia] succiniciproducens MBEL55E]|uniref:Uncharacterized protein n=1 Tax=Mannheimia succiniciproducens (strain KCTC 0769BP / MBEL55E) TaxID=221988 RepID=Q65SL0_MANSM|nr:unknown [[Mannheimia] succiniciproducens MBEL55E]